MGCKLEQFVLIDNTTSWLNHNSVINLILDFLLQLNFIHLGQYLYETMWFKLKQFVLIDSTTSWSIHDSVF